MSGSTVNPTRHHPHIRVTTIQLCPSLSQKPNPRNLLLMETSLLGSTEPGGYGLTGWKGPWEPGEATWVQTGAPWGVRGPGV